MKVKELSEILKTTTEDLIKKLSNVVFTERITEEYEVSKDLEKKLAKMFGVAYPFKTNKPKPPVNKPAVKIGSKPSEEKAPNTSNNLTKPSISTANNKPKVNNNNVPKIKVSIATVKE